MSKILFFNLLGFHTSSNHCFCELFDHGNVNNDGTALDRFWREWRSTNLGYNSAYHFVHAGTWSVYPFFCSFFWIKKFAKHGHCLSLLQLIISLIKEFYLPVKSNVKEFFYFFPIATFFVQKSWRWMLGCISRHLKLKISKYLLGSIQKLWVRYGGG